MWDRRWHLRRRRRAAELVEHYEDALVDAAVVVAKSTAARPRICNISPRKRDGALREPGIENPSALVSNQALLSAKSRRNSDVRSSRGGRLIENV